MKILREGSNQTNTDQGNSKKQISPLLGITFNESVIGPGTEYERKAGDYVDVPIFTTVKTSRVISETVTTEEYSAVYSEKPLGEGLRWVDSRAEATLDNFGRTGYVRSRFTIGGTPEYITAQRNALILIGANPSDISILPGATKDMLRGQFWHERTSTSSRIIEEEREIQTGTKRELQIRQ